MGTTTERRRQAFVNDVFAQQRANILKRNAPSAFDARETATNNIA